MNCRRFQDELFEYVEGTLSIRAQAAAEKHLAECNACRQAVEKEKRLTLALSSRLRQSSQNLALNPEIRRNILAASGQKYPSTAESLIVLCKYWFRLAAIPAAMMMLIAGALLANHFFGSGSRETIRVPALPHVAVALSARNNPQTSISVQMSYRTRRFHQEGNLVVDALVEETVVANGMSRDREEADPGKESESPELNMKTPL